MVDTNAQQAQRMQMILARRKGERALKGKVRPWRRFRTRVVDECADAIQKRTHLLMAQRDGEDMRPDRLADLNAVIGGMMAAGTIVRGLKYRDAEEKPGPDAEALAELLYGIRFGESVKEKFVKDWPNVTPRVRDIWLASAEAAIAFLEK